IDAALDLAKDWRMTETLPVARRLAVDEKLPAKVRAEAVLAVGQAGDKSDIPMLRRIAESKAAAEPFEQFNVILKGQAELDALWGRTRFGVEPKPTAEEWKKAYDNAVIKTGAVSIADCAWAAAVNCAGG